jgi:hypothetical protein
MILGTNTKYAVSQCIFYKILSHLNSNIFSYTQWVTQVLESHNTSSLEMVNEQDYILKLRSHQHH